MISNRSAPPGPVIPWLYYKDVPKAIEWLCGAFGFRERLRTAPEPDGAIHHAQLVFGEGAVVLIGTPPEDRPSRLLVRVENVDAHFDRAQKFGAKILRPPATHMFGERQYSAEDPAGHEWTFSESVADVDPVRWAGAVKDLRKSFENGLRPSFCYIEIPALDVHRSAGFYEKVFGWNIRNRESARPSFDDAAGHISGAWVTGRPISREPGLLPYIWVDGMDAVLARAASEGGEIVDAPHHDEPNGSSWIATLRDPAGNLMGLYQEAPR